MNLDWNLVRAFHATAEAGSLSAAARRLGLTQPTLSRQVAALETQLDVTLFERAGKRLILTETGRTLCDHVRRMADAADVVALAASGQAQTTSGQVCITATDGYATYILPDILARIRHEAPQITILVSASNSLSDLHHREADIAIRHVRPEQDGLIGKLARESGIGFYAAQDWVARHGTPQSLADLAGSDLIGFDSPDETSAFLRNIGVPMEAGDFRLMSNSATVVWELARRGVGISMMMHEIAARTPGMVHLLPAFSPITVPVWLVTHRELQTSRRIRLVFDILAEELARL